MKNKIHERLSKFFKVASVIFSGSVISSLWIYDNDNWKIYLPLILLFMTLDRFIYSD